MDVQSKFSSKWSHFPSKILLQRNGQNEIDFFQWESESTQKL